KGHDSLSRSTCRNINLSRVLLLAPSPSRDRWDSIPASSLSTQMTVAPSCASRTASAPQPQPTSKSGALPAALTIFAADDRTNVEEAIDRSLRRFTGDSVSPLWL